MHRCSNDILDANLKGIAKEFATRCKGLPLALEVLGSLLSKTKYNYQAWKKVLQTVSWQDEGCERIEIIAASYEHLPLAKKLCFLYFAVFPEDTIIDAKSLIRIWVAERPDEVNRTLEETAECFLEDLVQRSLVQVSKRFPDGSIKSCQVHDVLRDLAIHKAKEMNFLMVCSKVDDWKSCGKARRVAIHYSDFNKSLDIYASPNIRCLLIFGEQLKETADFSKYRLLKVLGNMQGKVLFERYEGNPHLKYLQLDIFVRYNYSEVFKFGKWLRSLKYLETLDLRGTDHIEDLSHWIWHVKTLRHVLLSDDILGPSLEHLKTQGPPASVDLKNLQTLQGVAYNESWETSGVPNIPQLRELDIRCCPKEGVATLGRLLCKLKHVVYLKVAGECEGFFKLRIRDFLLTKKIRDFPFYLNLKSLVLINYRIDVTVGYYMLEMLAPQIEMLPPYLTELSLRGFQFLSDPMPMLEKLRSLNTLHISLRGMPNPVEIRIKCSAGMFEQLEELVLEDLNVEEWEIEMGAMPMLKRLRIWHCGPLSVPPALIYLDRLQYLDWATDIQAHKDVINNIFKQRPHLRSYWDVFGDRFF